MANTERIDDIISEEAFKQVDQMLFKLGELQTGYANLAKEITTSNAQIAKVSSVKDLNAAVLESAKSFEVLDREQMKVIQSRKAADKAEKQLIETTKEKLSVDKESKKILDEYSGAVEKNIAFQIMLKRRLKELNEEQKALDKSLKAGTISEEKYSERSREIGVALAEGKQAVTDFNLEIRRSLKEANAAEGSYDSVSASLDRMRGLYKRLTAEERDNTEIGGKLLTQIQSTDKQLKDMDKTLGVTSRNVGNYKESVTEALNESGLFARQMNFLKEAQAGYTAVVRLAGISTASFTAILAASGIGAVLILLGGLVAFLTTTERGMDLVAEATAGLTTFINTFVVALSKLGEQIFDNTIPLLKSMATLLGGVVTQNAAMVENGLAGVQKGLDNIDPIHLADLTKEAIEAGKAAILLERQLDGIADAEADFNVERKKSEALSAELREKIADETVAMNERKAASEELFKIEEKNTNKSLGFLIQRLRIQEQTNALIDRELTQEELQKVRDIEIEIAEVRQDSAMKQRKFIKERQRLNKEAAADEAERVKAELEGAKKLSDAEFALQNERLKRSKDRTKAVAEDEKLSFEDRTDNLAQYLEVAEKQIVLARDHELANTELLENDRIRIKEKAEADILELKAEGVKTAEKILLDQLTKEEKILAEAAKIEINGIKTREAEKLTELQGLLNSGAITQKEYEAQRLAIIEQYGREAIEAEIRTVEAILAANKKKGIDVSEEERKLAELKMNLSDTTTKKTLTDLAKIEEKERELKQLQGELAIELFNLAGTLITQRFVKQEEALKVEGEANEARKEREIADINASVLSEEEKQLRISNAEKRAQLERERIAEKEKQLKVKKAQFDKVLAISGIIRSTAQAIMTQLAGAPLFPISGPLIPIIAGIGAAQLAQVVAQKVPKFAKGTKYSPEGVAMVGEQGSELRINPDGSTEMTPEKASLTYLKKGTQIIDHKKTMQLMDSKKGSFDAMVNEQRRGTEELKKAIKSKPSSSVNITKDGIYSVYKMGSRVSKYHQKLL
jgi:hypothetical protein